jgi:hypothetical protein
VGEWIPHIFLVNHSLREAAPVASDSTRGLLDGVESAEVLTEPNVQAHNTYE